MLLLKAALERAAGVAKFIQGEVLSVADACVVLGDASAPLTSETALQALESNVGEGILLVPIPTDDVVIITQTCDLQETTAAEPHCLVAPLRIVGPELAHEALRGRRPGLVALPWVNSECVADLSILTTVERSVLIGANSRGRPPTAQARLDFAESVGRYLVRPALPNHINNAVSPLLRRIRDRNDKNSAEGKCLQKVAEFRLEAFPDIDAESPDLVVLVVLEEQDLPSLGQGLEIDNDRVDQLKSRGIEASARAVLDAETVIAINEAWTALIELWAQPAIEGASSNTLVGALQAIPINGDNLSYARSRNAPLLDLRYLTTRAA
jgi:hypothetical protein